MDDGLCSRTVIACGTSGESYSKIGSDDACCEDVENDEDDVQPYCFRVKPNVTFGNYTRASKVDVFALQHNL